MAAEDRKIVIEHMTLAGLPMAPADDRFERFPAPPTKGAPNRIRADFPKVKARLVMPVDEDGRVARADKVYDVHYRLLAIAALSDYEDPVVAFTSYGLLNDMGWKVGGRQGQLLWRCLRHLRNMEVEVEGELPDPVMRHRSYPGIRSFNVINELQVPAIETRSSGYRNLSAVTYSATYLQTVANNHGVQIDVETLAQIRGPIPKAMYRVASWLRQLGEESIDLAEAFERVGSSRQRITPSDGERYFGQCFEVMRRYRHIRGSPAIEPNGKGGYTIHFNWDTPVSLPARGDTLYRELHALGIDSERAAAMVRENKRRAARVLQAYRMGALPAPRDTPARLIIGVFNDAGWTLPDLSEAAQLDLLLESRPRRRGASARPALTEEDLRERVQASPSALERARWLGVLRDEHAVSPADLGYRSDGSRLPRALN